MLKEHASLEPQVKAYRQYQQTLSEIEDAREMLAVPEMAELAQEELPALEALLAEAEALLPLVTIEK